MSALREGHRISNYILEAQRGVGSFGEVWRARHHVLRDVVAIKVPTDPQYVRNLQREGVTAHGLKHPNIVRVIDLDPYGDPPYLIMEYVEGPSLKEAIDSVRAEFPIPAAVAILRGVLNALSAAHAQGVIHRDIKPANILLANPLSELASTPERAVRVVDFGLGTIGGITTRSLAQSGSAEAQEAAKIAGTLAYMSPEHREGGSVDVRSDLYSAGVVLFEMLTGERPAGYEVPSALRSSVPPALDEVFRRCYARLDRRWKSADDVLAALTTVEPSVSPSPRAPHAHRPQRRGQSGELGPEGTACPGCEAVVERDDNFCIHCGRQLVAAAPVCRHCSAFVHTDDRFCIRCGKSLTMLS